MYKKIFIALFGLASVAGCTKDPSGVARKDVYNSGSYPTNLNALLGVLAAGYANFRSEGMDGFQLLCKDFACSEHTADLAYGGEQAWTELALNHLSTTNSYANDLWKSLYAGVKDVNVFLDRADFFEKNYAVPSEVQMVNNMRGEAYFLRALYYFYLECFYGEAYITTAGGADKMGVPIISSIPTVLDSTQKGRSTTRDVWNFIIGDLKKSADLLKGVQWTGSNRGRANEWAAKALLGKVYVFTQDWQNAKTTLLDVINNSGKSLMPFSKYKDAFNAKPENEFNEESLFEINVDRDSKGDYGIFGPAPNSNLTTSQGLIWSPCVIGDDGTETGSGGNLGYCNTFIHDKNLLRFGFTLPIYTLVNNPAFDASKPASYRNPKQVIDPAYKQQSIDMRNNKITDPRLNVCTMQPWVDSGSADGVNWRPITKFVGIGADIQKYFHGWSNRKFATYDNNIWAYSAADGANYYILRLADIFLLYAEACKSSGDNVTALEYINKVKRRAYSYPVNAPSPVDYASLTAKTKADAADVNLSNNPLAYERWAELFNEGHWWFDVCRWRIGKAEATYYNTTLPTGGTIDWSETRSYSWPIPSNEFNTNTVIAKQQNPGY